MTRQPWTGYDFTISKNTDGKEYFRVLHLTPGKYLLVKKGDKSILGWQGGRTAYIDRMTGHKYCPPIYCVFKLNSNGKLEDMLSKDFEYSKEKGSKKKAYEQALEEFEKMNAGKKEGEK